VDAQGDRQLDVGGAARTGDEDEAGSVPGLREHLVQVRAERRRVDDGQVDAGQQRDRARALGGREKADRPRLGKGEVGLGDPEVAPGEGLLAGVRASSRKPVLTNGCPQQVCSSGNWTATPSLSSRLTRLSRVEG
jgi:hypothetical protein